MRCRCVRSERVFIQFFPSLFESFASTSFCSRLIVYAQSLRIACWAVRTYLGIKLGTDAPIDKRTYFGIAEMRMSVRTLGTSVCSILTLSSRASQITSFLLDTYSLCTILADCLSGCGRLFRD